VTVTTNDDVMLWWTADGDGDLPLLLVQGLGYTADMWFRLLPGLSSRRRVIRLDNRGVGRSDVPPTPWTMAQMADDAVAVLDAAGVGQAHVFGVSMGGLIAQELALRRPDRVASLLLGCSHPGGRDAVRMDAAAATMLMDRSPKTPRDVAEASVPFLYAEDTSRDVIDTDLEVRLRHPLRATAYWGQLDAMREHDGTLSRLPAVSAPTLVMHGTADRLVQPGNAQLIAEAVPGARLEWIDGAGHLFWTDQTDRTLGIVNDFIDGVEGERAATPPGQRAATPPGQQRAAGGAAGWS
jgi:pimeloyl-ACP methyl ester carboxylesterase